MITTFRFRYLNNIHATIFFSITSSFISGNYVLISEVKSLLCFTELTLGPIPIIIEIHAYSGASRFFCN